MKTTCAMRALVVSNMYPTAAEPTRCVFIKRIVEQQQRFGILPRLVVRAGTKGGKLKAYASFYARAFWAALTASDDIIFVHFATHSAPPVLLALLIRSRIPLVINVHGADVVAETGTGRLRALVLKWITTKALDRADVVVAPSIYFRNVLMSQYGVSQERILISPSGGVDMGAFISVPPNLSAPRRLLYLGRLIEGKGPLLLLDAIELVAKRLPEMEIEVTIAGDGPLRERVSTRIGNMSSNVNTQMLGRVPPDKIPELMAQSHFVVFPSTRRAESLGLVVVEAMAAGRPVVAADGGAMAELIQDGVNGFLVKQGDVEELSRGIERMLVCSDEELLTYCRQARSVAARFDGQLVGKDLADQLIRRFSNA